MNCISRDAQEASAGGNCEADHPPANLAAAVALLIEEGTARTTTLQVQQRACVSRGALLHHFPTRAALLAAAAEELVHSNERAVQESLAKLQGPVDATERAIRVLAIASTRPAYMAGLELWAVARTDGDLRYALLQAERGARMDSDRVLSSLFGPTSDNPAHGAVAATTHEFIRGSALSMRAAQPGAPPAATDAVDPSQPHPLGTQAVNKVG